MKYFENWKILWLLILFKDVRVTTLTAEDLIKELSWSLKLKLLNQMAEDKDKNEKEKQIKENPEPEIPAENPGSTHEPSESSISPETRLRNGPQFTAQSLNSANPYLRAEDPEIKPNNDENDMRLKLFRLMYETVRDSDIKVRRAELIKDHYTNSSAFEVGYLIGDITDKNNIIQDIAMTLRKFHREWKPIEHINAYEQIANQGIEITHLTDLIRVVMKRNSTDTPETPKEEEPKSKKKY